MYDPTSGIKVLTLIASGDYLTSRTDIMNATAVDIHMSTMFEQTRQRYLSRYNHFTLRREIIAVRISMYIHTFTRNRWHQITNVTNLYDYLLDNLTFIRNGFIKSKAWNTRFQETITSKLHEFRAGGVLCEHRFDELLYNTTYTSSS